MNIYLLAYNPFKLTGVAYIDYKLCGFEITRSNDGNIDIASDEISYKEYLEFARVSGTTMYYSHLNSFEEMLKKVNFNKI